MYTHYVKLIVCLTVIRLHISRIHVHPVCRIFFGCVYPVNTGYIRKGVNLSWEVVLHTTPGTTRILSQLVSISYTTYKVYKYCYDWEMNTTIHVLLLY